MSTVSNTTVKTNGAANNTAGGEKGPVFSIHNIYLKDLSFEAPESPEIFRSEWKPHIDFDLQMGTRVLSEAESVYEATLHITVTIRLGEKKEAKDNKTVLLIELKQAGAFTIRNVPEDQVKHLMATACSTILFPYARETISALATKGGFPQLVLPPINFDAMYEQHLATQQGNPVAEEATQT